MKDTALIVIDYINDIVHEKGKMASCAKYVKENNVIDKVNTALKNARKKNYSIIHIQLGHDKDYNTCCKTNAMFNVIEERQAFILGSWGTEFYADIDINDNELIVVKHRVSGFYGTDLEAILRSNRVEKIIIAGVSTNMAVELTAREAFDRDYIIEIVEDACASYNKEMHDFSIKFMSNFSRIIKSTEI
jgi:nicotinamidase-related amidase